ERNIDVLEVLIGQIREYRNIDFAIGKAFHVLGHTEVLEPVLNVLHRAPGSYLQPATARSLPVLAEIEETRPSRRRTHRTHRIVASSVPSYRPFWVRFNSPPMSALGQKQTWQPVGAMSALPPKADIAPCNYEYAPEFVRTVSSSRFDPERPCGLRAAC